METNLQNLSALSCVVKAKFPGLISESSACGTIINFSKGIVITHGSILTEHVSAQNKLILKVQNGQFISQGHLSGSVFHVLLSNQALSGHVENQNSLVTEGVSSASVGPSKNSHTNFTDVGCQLIGAFRNKDFHKTLNEMMPNSSWSFNDAIVDGCDRDTNAHDSNNLQHKKQEGYDSDVGCHLLSYFLILKLNLGLPKDFLNQNPVPYNFLPVKTNRCIIGETAEIIATPFGSLCPGVFFNAYSRGVISNVSGADSCWIVTDARCIPGCEGGPLYTKRKPTESTRYLTGIIASSLCWKNSEWVGFSIVCGIHCILNSVMHYRKLFPRDNIGSLTTTRKQQISHFVRDQDQVQAATVLIQCGSTWGTGVIVDRNQGVLLTCSHVVKDANSLSVTVTPSKSRSTYTGKVVYMQDPVRTPYDLAVIKCPEATQHLPSDWSIQVSKAFVGQEVIVSGHAVFNTDCHLEPSVCQGVVSKVITRRHQPVMVQTTCAIHAGASGGPLLTPEGCLVGIVVCNTRDSASNSNFPHVNLCIPVGTVWPVIQKYLSTRDKHCLNQLQVQDLELTQLWALGTKCSGGHEMKDGYSKSKL